MTGVSPLLEADFVARLEKVARIARKALAGEIGTGAGRIGRAGSGSRFREHRPYVAGDDLRTLDWNALGRLGEPFVKVFEPEEGGPVAVLLDASASLRCGAPPRFDLALRLAAAFGTIALLARGAVVVLAPPRAEPLSLRGAAGARGLLESLATLSASGADGLAEAARFARGLPEPPTSGVVVTDGEPPEALDRALAVLPRRRSLVVHLLAREDLGAPFEGRVRFANPEGEGTRLVLVTPALRLRFARLVRARVREVERIARRREAAYVRAFSDESWEGVVLSALRVGGLR